MKYGFRNLKVDNSKSYILPEKIELVIFDSLVIMETSKSMKEDIGMKKRRWLSALLAAALMVGFSGCGNTGTSDSGSAASDVVQQESETSQAPSQAPDASLLEEAQQDSVSIPDEEQVNYNALVSSYSVNHQALQFDTANWNYDADNDVYYQIGVGYCSDPDAIDYETMGIMVPGAYLDATDNGDGTYTCTLSQSGIVSGFTAQTAPVIMPINTAGYSAQAAPTSYSYSSVSSYLEAGYVYVYSGCRGRSNGYNEDGSLSYAGGAPWGVTDLKAAVRYLRLNNELIPGDPERIFACGHSGGGAQTAVLGATGDSELYFDYLASIGAAMYDEDGNYISDAICGAMCWCPITSLDYADEAYEWNMGQYMDTDTRAEGTWTRVLSQDLAAAYGEYINELGLVDENGNSLTLEESDDGIYTSGSYADYLQNVIETSLNNFLSDTEFPYTPSSGTMADGGFGAPPDGGAGDPPGDLPDDGGPAPWETNADTEEAVTYETPEDYIASLNEQEEWVKYDSTTGTAEVLSLGAFARVIKNATKSVGAFDDLSRGQAENYVFGDTQNDALHFDVTMAALLEENQEKYSASEDFDTQYAEDYQEYKNSVDDFGSDSLTRQAMYNPMYFISDYYDGADSTTVAVHWRIHSGITQGDTALTVEMNLALALEQCRQVEDVEFQTVWGQGHTMAERTGSSTDNFIEWVAQCVAE